MIFCDGIFSCTVSVCVCDGMVEVNMGHDPTCSSSYAPLGCSELSKHGPAEAYSQRMNKKMSLNLNNRGFFNENELFMMILLFI